MRPTTAALVRTAAAAYGANCALGLAVQLRVVDTRAHRWVHHALYLVTLITTGTAVASGLARRSATGVALLPALAPLAILPHAGRGMHARTALTAAPWYVEGLLIGRGA